MFFLAWTGLFCLLLTEIGGRLLFPEPSGYFVLMPNQREVFHLPGAMLSQVPAVARHRTNAQGVRGQALSSTDRYRVLAIGGSTTACNVLDEPQTWPARLQAILQTNLAGEHIWVGNLGKDGLNTRHHLVTMSRFLPQHPKVDAVLLLVGVNDFLARLAQDDQFRPMSIPEIDSDPAVLTKTFANTPPEAQADHSYRHLGIWRVYARAKSAIETAMAPAPAKALASFRARRQNAREIRTTLPDLEPALKEFEQNLEALLERGRAQGLRVIFLTQPTLWKSGSMPPAEEASLMFGLVKPTPQGAQAYYSAAALAEGMRRYNQVTRNVSARHNVECLDLAGNLKPDPSLLYDDCHLNISGAEQVARLIADYLLRSPPLAGAGLH
jgi:lysophospholipase L1-like esterase